MTSAINSGIVHPMRRTRRTRASGGRRSCPGPWGLAFRQVVPRYAPSRRAPHCFRLVPCRMRGLFLSPGPNFRPGGGTGHLNVGPPVRDGACICKRCHYAACQPGITGRRALSPHSLPETLSRPRMGRDRGTHSPARPAPVCRPPPRHRMLSATGAQPVSITWISAGGGRVAQGRPSARTVPAAAAPPERTPP